MSREDYYSDTERDAELWERDRARDDADYWKPDIRDVMDLDALPEPPRRPYRSRKAVARDCE